MTVEDWAQKIQAGDPRSVARAISAIETGENAGSPLLQTLFRRARRARVIGITGAPGAGKSTLVEKLAAAYRENGLRVGILAVDPTSPFSSGAILGDRIRMQRLSTDPGVFIRSMATRGHLGGLAPATQDAATVLMAAGFDVILVETVGVGQDEVQVAKLADFTVLVLAPGTGDDVQVLKAGVMEIADIFVINKAEAEGADRLEHSIATMISIAPREDGWRRPIIQTVATTGQGVNLLRQALDDFQSFAERTELRQKRDRDKWRERLLEMLRDELFRRVVTPHLADSLIDTFVMQIVERSRDPHSAVEEILRNCFIDPRTGTQ
jgi:LAO/AO transport system kinase